MALSTTGYTASGAGTAAANGNYVPCAAPNATYNGATQYTNGTDFLVFNGAVAWFITGTLNLGSAPFYNSGASGSTTNMPLTGWVLTGGSSYSAPAPTFVDMAAAAIAASSISGISIISGISSISF